MQVSRVSNNNYIPSSTLAFTIFTDLVEQWAVENSFGLIKLIYLYNSRRELKLAIKISHCNFIESIPFVFTKKKIVSCSVWNSVQVYHLPFKHKST